jgi:hypothetical protein
MRPGSHGIGIWVRFLAVQNARLACKETFALYIIRCKESMFLGVDEKFSPCKSASCKKYEKYLKKVLACSEKSCTFAPAFPEREGLGRRDGKQESSLKV